MVNAQGNESAMTPEAGAYVENPSKPEWGVGRVLEVLGPGKCRVYFENQGQKNMLASFLVEAKPETVPLALEVIQAGDNLAEARPMKSLQEMFLDLFPLGFKDPVYYQEERGYKVLASEFVREQLARTRLEELLRQGEHDAVCKLAVQAINKSNLIFPNEKMALNDALKAGQETRKSFAIALFFHLYGDAPLELRFESFVSHLYDLGAAKWTTCTYFLHMAFPESCPFMKPGVTKRAAKGCGYPLQYSSEITWQVYKSLIDFSEHIRRLIEPHSLLRPVDMIDIQGFIWCCNPEKYSPEERARLDQKRAKLQQDTGSL